MNKKTKDWYNRHKDLVIKDGWSKQEYDYILDTILLEDYHVLQDLLLNLNNKTIKDLVDLLSTSLKIGNKKLDIRLQCANCGREIIRNMAEFNKKRIYCNIKCREEYSSSHNLKKGKNNVRYNSYESNCTNCNKKIIIPKYKRDRKNKFQDNHNFCSKECYWEFRSKYYIGEKASMYNFKPSKKQRNKQRMIAIDMLSNNKFPTKLTSIHKKINILLDKMNVKYINEKPYKYYCVDIYLPQYNLIIEIMGDYFHANPKKYKNKKINDMQLKNIKRDKAKHTYIKKYYHIEILYLWESDIHNEIDKCESLIKEYIENKGKLKKYNSYEY